MSTNAFQSRINELPLSIGMKRYSDGPTTAYHTETHLWKLVVSHFCGRDVFVEQEVNIQDLTALRALVDQCIETVKTDGRRLTEDKAQ